MNSNPFSLISILISAILAFFTIALIVEMILIVLKKFFKVNHGRIHAIARSLPFISLFSELITSHFSIGYLFNPLNCTSCVQKTILTLFFPDVKSYLSANEISLLNHLGEGSSHAMFQVIGIALATLTLFSLIYKALEVVSVSKLLRTMERESVPSSRVIENPLLAQAFAKHCVKIFVSPTVDTPLATYSKTIFIPKEVETAFAQEEFEAVLAHELEHIRCMDSYVRLLAQVISSIYWWVPTYGWRKRLEFDQEIACDQSILRYGYQNKSLASALIKVCASSKEKSHQQLCYLTEKKHDSVRRLESMLASGSTSSKYLEWMSFILVIIFFGIVLTCTLIS